MNSIFLNKQKNIIPKYFLKYYVKFEHSSKDTESLKISCYCNKIGCFCQKIGAWVKYDSFQFF